MSKANSASGKLHIIGLEKGGDIEAMYNPKELQIDKSVPWQKAKNSKADKPDLEFTSADGRSMSFELMFDTFEEGTSVFSKVDQLLQLAMVMEEGGSEDKKRPTRVKVVWGTLPAFEGVIESISTKYTMFLPDGTPVRATCNVKVKEANKASKGSGS